jgi:uncharacterized RDD family membrane protein YckC
VTPRSVKVLWPRFWAYLIDGVLLAIVGWFLIAVFGGVIVKMGAASSWIGLPIELFYFGWMDSWRGGGQTFGKRACQIRVVDAAGNPISEKRATLRAYLFVFPYFIGGSWIDGTGNLALIASFLILSFTFANSYFLIFNRRTHQSLCDLTAGSYVVQIKAEQSEMPRPYWRPHLQICIGIIILVSALSFSFYPRIKAKIGPGIYIATDEINRIPGVVHSDVKKGSTHSIGAAKTEYIRATVYVSDSIQISSKDFAGLVAKTLIQAAPEAKTKKVVQVILVHQVSVGIWAKRNTQTFEETPDVWLATHL